ncbi:MAG TPA: hypothetical protein VFV46_00565 [Lacibacter sp.]|nr:hypothetical protein [Lacibacter sp.]
MIKDFLQDHLTAILSVGLTILFVAIRLFFWQMEMRELRMFGHHQSPVSKKQKQTYKRTSYADAA